ncbi:MAG: sodium:alanine symporter [Candidatus Desulfovibrio kirbyi]|uniref:Sodium:alanine symporter n=1 Tax=Candidatus Desulfovibrio kirbyi TaxID=2696086 RepID=A0A6L2R5V5_9BACT|nr:MAG: sodium:alanine symporter [Candidatus Desulfovibrio kirbyi]
MQILEQLVAWLDDIVWGPYVLFPLLLGAGIYFTIELRFMPWRYVGPAFVHLWKGRHHHKDHGGELSPFKALMTSMAATVGTGNIVGVATAITLGGPGAVFWMWVTAALGMATKFCEATLAVHYRETTPNGSYVGGPMYYIKNGLGSKWKWLAFLFAVFGIVASFGIGNMAQANAITNNVAQTLNIPPWTIALTLLALTGIVVVGGVKRVGDVTGILVPLMALFYIIVGVLIMIINYDKIGPAFLSIFRHAFAPAPAAGGFIGATVMMSMRYGIARGLFSNEAGLGSAPIAHATAITDNPVKQGFLGMLDPFIDTIIVCSITAIVILIAGDWTSTESRSAATITSLAFEHALPGMGNYVVSLSIVLFAYSTILGWCVYGERCCMYIFGHEASLPFRIFFTLLVPVGALAKFSLVWDLADLFNGLMALPNLIALLLLSPVVFKLVHEHFDAEKTLREWN